MYYCYKSLRTGELCLPSGICWARLNKSVASTLVSLALGAGSLHLPLRYWLVVNVNGSPFSQSKAND
jgi:hypothetical protein